MRNRIETLEIIENRTTYRIAGVLITGTGRLCDVEGLMHGRTGWATDDSESGDSMRFLLRFMGERITGDSPESKRSVVEELLGKDLSVVDDENLPE